MVLMALAKSSEGPLNANKRKDYAFETTGVGWCSIQLVTILYILMYIHFYETYTTCKMYLRFRLHLNNPNTPTVIP